MHLVTLHDETTSFEPGHGDFFRYVMKKARPGETGLAAATRMMVNGSLERCDGQQKLAAQALLISPRLINFYAGRLKLRPKDRLAKERAS